MGDATAAAMAATAHDFGDGRIAPAADASVLRPSLELAEPTALALPDVAPLAPPPELAAQLDGAAGPGLRERFAGPLEQQAQAQLQFEDQRTATLLKGQADAQAAEHAALMQQEAARAGAQADVAAARKSWQDQVSAVQTDASVQAQGARAEQQTAIDAEHVKGNAAAQKHLDDAEAQAAAKRTEAERKAESETKSAEQESGGFWGWVASKAKALVDGLKSVVNAIYDGLRAAVKAVFDAAKKLAEAAIELARLAIVTLIEGYALLLKGIVRVALAAFPKLADAACKRIDAAVAKATSAVNAVADGLKKGITAILDFVASTLDKILGLVQAAYNAAFTLIGMVISGEWKEIVQGLMNLGASAAEAPPQFEAAAYEELLGGDMSQPLSPVEMQLAGLTPPGASAGAGGAELPGPPWSADNVGVDGVLDGMELSPELSASLVQQTGGQGEVSFGQSEDPSRSMESILGMTGAGTGADTATAVDDGLSVSERAGAKWTIMKKGLSDWWSKNWPLLVAGGVVGIAGFIAANVLSGGAVLAAIPPILSVLGPLFMGMMAVQVAGYVADYLGKGWAGDTKPAGKSLAKAAAVGVIELLSYLTFKAGGAALKGAKAVAAGAKAAGKGALNLAKRGVAYVVKQGKVLLKGLSNTALGKAFTKLDDLGKSLLAKTRFKGFRIRVAAKRFTLEGKVNPWVPIAGGSLQILAESAEQIDDLAAKLKASGKVDSADIAGAKGTTADDLIDELVKKAKTGDHGAMGELAALERKVLQNGDDLSLLREVDGADKRFTQEGAKSRGNTSGKKQARTTPDYRTKGSNPELVDVKTAVDPPSSWKNWLQKQIKSVNRQLKNSRLRSGNPGGADLQLFKDAAENMKLIKSADPKVIEDIVIGAMKGRNTSLTRVTIFADGNKLFEFVRDASGAITRTI